MNSYPGPSAWSLPDWDQPPPPTPAPAHDLLRVAVAAGLAGLLAGGLIGFAVRARGGKEPVNAALTPQPTPFGTPSSPAPALTARVVPSVVDINTSLDFGAGEGAGTGMIITRSGDILTNNHVIDGATKITVTLTSTGQQYPGVVVGTDPSEDIAVLHIQGASNLTPIKSGNPGTVSAGDPILAVGNALGRGGTPATVSGTVEAVNQTITASDPGGGNPETLQGLIQTNAPIQPGDSGGPLLNWAGEVIGMDTAAGAGRSFNVGASVGFAIPITTAINIAKQIEAGQASSTVHIGLPAFLGVGFSSDSPQVTEVEPGSPAARAGIARGDTITTIGGQAIDSPEAASAAIKSHHPGDRVAVRWRDRSGAQHNAVVTLASGPAD